MILQQLREQTSGHHKNLENSALLRHLNDGSISFPIYGQILQKFYGYFYPLERQLQQIAPLSYYLTDYPTRRKSTALFEDLVFLQYPTFQLEECQALPNITNLSAAFGCLYVMEGSTLGAKVISKVIQEALGITEVNGGSYFRGYGPQTGEYWKNFCSVLQHYAETEGDAEQIIETANQTFISLKQWLDRQ